MINKARKGLMSWITYEEPYEGFPMCDFERISYEVRPGDVLLIEGRSRVSEVIKQITQSPWSHASLYIGRIHDIEDVVVRKKLAEHFPGAPNTQLVIEGYLGRGTIATPLEAYETDHIRICRPRGLSRRDSEQVISYAISQLGKGYDVRQIFDLWRFLMPWGIFPRRWRSSLFEHHLTETTKTVCSTMIAESFASVDFPILPVIKKHEETGIELFKRHPKVYTPKDFDYSPYFEIIKYPFIEINESGPYRKLPWNKDSVASIEGTEFYPINKDLTENKKKTKEKTKIKDDSKAAMQDKDQTKEDPKNTPQEQISTEPTSKVDKLRSFASRLNPLPPSDDLA
jgi:hypothetical protein